MADISKIADHLTLDPDTRGYAEMTDAEAATSLNLERTENGPFPAKDITKLLAVRGKVPASLIIGPALQGFDDVDLADANHLAAITNGMDHLISEGVADADDKAAVLALDTGRVKFTDAGRYGLLGRSKEIGPAHVEKARAL